ncbi:unnamed protein product, partial [marine sediment metagenome]
PLQEPLEELKTATKVIAAKAIRPAPIIKKFFFSIFLPC